MRNPLLACALTALATPLLLAQGTGRTMQLLAPAVLGQTASFGVSHPASAAGNLYSFLWCMPPFAGTMPLSVPGFAVQGTLRVDPANSVTAFTGVFGAGGSVAHALAIPNHPSFVGVSWDLQSIDLAVGAGVLSLADNELAVVLAGGPPAHLNMVPIPAGAFQMGSSVTPLNAAPHFNRATSQPVHLVKITRPFWMGKYEVTQAAYQALMGSNPSYEQSPQRPVESVTWFMAMDYCQVLTAQEQAAGRLPSGYVYRLPTEAEWEYCCRAGTAQEFHYGPTLVCGQAHFGYSYHTNSNCGTSLMAVVGSYAPNAWGLHDMHGNAAEWCLDSWDRSANYPVGPVSDPYVTSGSYQVLRGGARYDYSNQCRSAHRSWYDPGNTNNNIGFRVVCAPVLTHPVRPPAFLNMIPIPAGSFQMGSPEPIGVPPHFNRATSRPVHTVTITRPFWMGKYEVTQAEYQALMGSNPSWFPGPQLPVEWVSWNNALAYCQALTAREQVAGRLPAGYVYRLPTEAEWEYCCRAGTTTEFHVGGSLSCGHANFDNCIWMPVSVGSYAPNAWGLHDMHGNVLEWCLDSWNASANYPAGPVSDPYVTSGLYRVLRGGGWNDDSVICRSAHREWGFPGNFYDDIGFRVVCAPVLQ